MTSIYCIHIGKCAIRKQLKFASLFPHQVQYLKTLNHISSLQDQRLVMQVLATQYNGYTFRIFESAASFNFIRPLS